MISNSVHNPPANTTDIEIPAHIPGHPPPRNPGDELAYWNSMIGDTWKVLGLNPSTDARDRMSRIVRLNKILGLITSSYGPADFNILKRDHIGNRLGNNPSTNDKRAARNAFAMTVKVYLWRLILDNRAPEDITILQGLLLSDGYLDYWFQIYRERLANPCFCSHCGLGWHLGKDCPASRRNVTKTFDEFKDKPGRYTRYRRLKAEFDARHWPDWRPMLTPLLITRFYRYKAAER